MGSLFSTPSAPEAEVTPVESTTEVDSQSAAKNKSARKKKTTDYSMGNSVTSGFSSKGSTGRTTLGGA